MSYSNGILNFDKKYSLHGEKIISIPGPKVIIIGWKPSNDR